MDGKLNPEDCKQVQVTKTQHVRVKDDPETSERTRKVICLGRCIFFSNFLTGSLILLYVFVLYAVLSEEMDLSCQHDSMVALLVILSVSDFIMIVQHFVSFFALIHHYEVGLVGCIIAHTISGTLKIIGGIIIIQYGDNKKYPISSIYI